MKKIRILAMILAMLMIPFGMLFACNGDEEPEVKPEENEGEENEGGGKNEIVSVGNKVVEDGSRNGYISFFSFDNADIGNLGVIPAPQLGDSNYAEFSELKPIEPYDSYFKGTLVNGGAYTVKSMTGGGKYLSIQRTGGKVSAPTLDFSISNIVNDVQQTHIIEFKMEFVKGLYGSAVTFSGVKSTNTQTLLEIEDDVMYDCNGDAIYGEKSTDKEGWIKIAIVINDAKRTYDIYIDSVKQTNGLTYSNDAYTSWNQDSLTGYRFAIAATTDKDTYMRIDDFSVRNGTEKNLGQLEGTDFVEKFYDFVTFEYSFLNPNKAGIIKLVSAQIFGGEPLLNALIAGGANVTEIVETKIEDIYASLKGDYTDILEFEKGDTKLVVNTGSFEASYDVEATGKCGYITFTFDKDEWNVVPYINSKEVAAVKYDVANKLLTVYSDASCAEAITTFEFQKNENGVLTFKSEGRIFELNTENGTVAYRNEIIGERGNGYTVNWEDVVPQIGGRDIVGVKVNNTTNTLSVHSAASSTNENKLADFESGTVKSFVNINNAAEQFIIAPGATADAGEVTYSNGAVSVSGTYTVAGGIYTFTWNTTAPQIDSKDIVAAKYNEAGGAFRVYADAACTNAEKLAEYDTGARVYTHADADIGTAIQLETSGNTFVFKENFTGKHDYIITFNSWEDEQAGSADVVAAKYDAANKVLSVYTDAACTTKLADFTLDETVSVENTLVFVKGDTKVAVNTVTGGVEYTVSTIGTYSAEEGNVFVFNFSAAAEQAGSVKVGALKYDEEAENVVIYADAACTEVFTQLNLPSGTIINDVNYIITVNGNSKLVLKTDGTVSYDNDVTDGTDAVTGTYTLNNGVVEFTWTTAPKISEKDIKAAKYDAAANTLEVYSDVECTDKLADFTHDVTASTTVLGVNRVKVDTLYAIKLKNGSFVTLDTLWYTNNESKLSPLMVEFYVTEAAALANTSFKLKFYVAADKAEEITVNAGEEAKFDAKSKTLTYIAGHNAYELTAAALTEANIDIKSLIKIEVISEDADFAVYFTKLGFDVKDVSIEVEGPDGENSKCTHMDALEESTLQPFEFVEGDCKYGSHYLLKCSVCGATKVDTTKEIGHLEHHSFEKDEDGSDKIYFEEAGCFKNGRKYKKCEVCGHEELVEVIYTEGHAYVLVGIEGKEATQVCKVCGVTDSFIVRLELMEFAEKLAELGFLPTEKNSWSTSREGYDKFNTTFTGGVSGYKFGWMSFTSKNNSGVNVKTAYTDYGTMLKITGGSSSQETYLDFVPVASTTSFFKATSFVLEFDYMLGKAGTGGYPAWQVGVSWRNGPTIPGKWGTLLFTSDGGVRLGGYSTGNTWDTSNSKLYNMEAGKVYNLAQHYDLINNKIELYINGVKYDECQFLGSVAESSTFSPTHYRPWAYMPVGAEVYFDNFLHYAADKEPICVLTTGITSDGYEGDVELEDELLGAMNSGFEVVQSGRPIQVNVPAVNYLKNYVFEFNVAPKAALGNGTLLQATKNGLGIDRTENIVTVKDGKVYVLGVLVSESTNIKLSLVFDDSINQLVVYVNGQRIAGSITLEGEFADAAATIRSFTFVGECGDYTVSGLKMYTGSELK